MQILYSFVFIIVFAVQYFFNKACQLVCGSHLFLVFCSGVELFCLLWLFLPAWNTWTRRLCLGTFCDVVIGAVFDATV